MNAEYQSRLDAFLASTSVAIAGYSRQKNAPANAVYKKFEENGYQVYAVSPHADEIEEVSCFQTISTIPETPEAVVLFTPPSATMNVLEECSELGIKKVWIHHSVDQGSFTPGVEEFAAGKGMELIPFGCPMMFLKPDIFHRCMRWFFNLQKKFDLEPEDGVGQSMTSL